VVIGWPEGESFRITKKVSSKSVRLNIRRDKDWFAANGEVQVDENKVMNLRELLGRLREDRFVALGDNQFLALTDELHRRLTDLSAYTDADDEALRFHPLASFALEEMALEAGEVDADAAWRKHLQHMAGERGLPAAAADHPAGRAARLPGRGLRMAGAPGALGRGRLPGRRHGPRQNPAGAGPDPVARARRPDPGGGADLGRHQLDGRSGALRADPEHEAVRRRRPRRDAEGSRGLRRGRRQLRPAAAGSGAVRRTCAGTPSCWTRRRRSRTRTRAARRR
jgi:hypothetical protein